MMNFSGIMVFGLHIEVFLMLASGVFYLICAGLLWKPYRQEKNELIGALMTFLVYQAISMFFMGMEMLTMNMVYSNIAGLAIFIGSVYMLKFPFSSFSQGTRKTIFRITMIAVLVLFIWFMLTPARQMSLMNFSIWYDIAINGLLVGGSILLLSFRTSERWLRLKAFGGSSGVISCCVVANATLLSGAFLTSSVFQFLAPVLIIGSLTYAHKKQKESVTA
jgi:hypothetical protein